jgi:hypothetical protein
MNINCRYQISIKSIKHTYPITKKSKQEGKYTIRNKLKNNEYNTSLLAKALPHSQKQNIHKDQKHQKTKWAKFTYCGKEIR